MNLLEKLYYGHLSPCERIPERHSEHLRLIGVVEENGEKLMAALDDEGKQQLSALLEAHAELDDMAGLDGFVEGFRLSAWLIRDTFSSPKPQPPEEQDEESDIDEDEE